MPGTTLDEVELVGLCDLVDFLGPRRADFVEQLRSPVGARVGQAAGSRDILLLRYGA